MRKDGWVLDRTRMRLRGERVPEPTRVAESVGIRAA
jgi:hypothetical protein